MARLEVIAAMIFSVYITMIQTQFNADLISKCNKGDVVCTGCGQYCNRTEEFRKSKMTWDDECFPTESNTTKCQAMMIGIREATRIVWTVFYILDDRPDMEKMGFFVMNDTSINNYGYLHFKRIMPPNRPDIRESVGNFFDMDPDYDSGFSITPHQQWSFWTQTIMERKRDGKDTLLDLESEPISLAVVYYVLAQNNRTINYRKFESLNSRKSFNQRITPKPELSTPKQEEKIGLSTAILGGIIVLSLVIVASLIFLIVICMKKNKKKKKSKKSAPKTVTFHTVKTVDSNG